MDDLDYLKKGHTIYDFLGRQFPFLRGDFSIQSLLEGTLEFSKEQEFYVGAYKEVYRTAVKGIKITSKDHKNGEIDANMELLARLYSMQSYDPSVPSFGTLEEYLDYTVSDENITNPELATTRREILKTGIRYIKSEDLLKLKSNLLKGIYLPKAREIIRRKNRALGISGDTPEIKSVSDIEKLVRDPARLAEYDGVISKIREKVGDFEARAVDDVITTYKRARTVQSGLMSAAPAERAKALEGSQLDVPRLLFGHTEIPQKDDSYSWTLEKFEFPKLILNEEAIYSNDGSADQKVVAISYGKFRYGTMKQKDGSPTVSSDLLELVGVTRIGDDGRRDYYVLVPMDNQAYKTNGHFDVTKYMKEQKQAKFMTMEKYGFFDETYEYAIDRIPPELREFYASVFFSDIYLREAINNNYRYTGWVEASEGGRPQIKADDTMVGNAYDLEAARFAATHGSDDYKFTSLDTPSAFIEFYRVQKGIVDSLLEKDREKRAKDAMGKVIKDVTKKDGDELGEK